jgi:hypothetical protein
VTAPQLLADLTRQGFTLAAEGGGIKVTPASRLTPALREAILAHKPDLLAGLARAGRGPDHADGAHRLVAGHGQDGGETPAVTISGKQYPYCPRWQGGRLGAGDLLAFDTETEKLPDDPVARRAFVPRLALASASAGEADSCLIHPDDVGKFILEHRRLHFVCHNAAFDFWVVEQHLRCRGEQEALAAWWELVEQGRLHDSLLLDQLLPLARDDARPVPRDLATVALEHAGLVIDKSDPYRLRYGEIIGVDWAQVEPGFFDYAIKDAIATLPTYLEIRRRAQTLADRFHDADVLPDARSKWGLLTEQIQVWKAIALASIERNGLHLDRERLARAEAGLRRHLGVTAGDAHELCPDLFKKNKKGELALSKNGVPSKDLKALRTKLQQILDDWPTDAGPKPRIPLTEKNKELSTAVEAWAEYRHAHPFLDRWVEFEETAKLLQAFGQLRGTEHVHPRYTVLVRTGRTSCSSPNIQQVPKDDDIRGAFVPSPGHFLLAIDYSFIELRTLAAVCVQRYGQSALANTIKAGVDPHARTAAMMLDVPVDDFLSWKNDPQRKDDYAAARQKAKAINFGVPGGLGIATLRAHARSTYGIDMTQEESQTQRDKLITGVYPELTAYLDDDMPATLARSLQCPVEQVRAVQDELFHLTCVRKVLEGNPRKADGESYSEGFVARIWAALVRLNRNPELTEALQKRQPGKDLAAKVCHAGVATLTGRIRGRVRYTAARNSPFQGLAADGAALALFALVREGFRVVAFVHDEVLVELPDEGGYVSEAKVRRVEEVMCREMEGVLVGGIPVACEAALSRRWDKKAKLVVRDGKVFPWEPQPTPADERNAANLPAQGPAAREDQRGDHDADQPARPAPGAADRQPGPEAAARSPRKVSALTPQAAGPGAWRVECADALDFLAALPDDAVNLVLGSPPYPEKGERYAGGRQKWDTADWLEWMLRVTEQAVRACSGYVLWVVATNQAFPQAFLNI